ncbi:MAG TPA: putative Ig domain-containing protein [Candidatus Binatia bacterium]|nr:putative Ig domain-containing protein [Candidatus Binatia bacterium]
MKFEDGLDLESPDPGSSAWQSIHSLGSPRVVDVLSRIRGFGGRWRRASTIDRGMLRTLSFRAEQALGKQIANLSNYYIVELPAGAPAEAVIDALNGLPEVELALAAPLPAPAPSVPDFATLQGYLSPAPGGQDAQFAWSILGGTGAGVSICDIEGGWNLDHEDLPASTILVPPADSLGTIPKDDHGTEVLGTMFSLPNGWGTTGASYGARCFVAPVYLDSGYALFQQILWAATQLEAGDVILIEAQTIGPYYRGDGTQLGYVPVEWQAAIYNAILAAVGNGIHVIEPAGNGNQDLDDPVYAAGNFGHAPFLPENNSGAIMVGAGVPPIAPELGPDRSRSTYSNFGSRLDLQSWGHRVVTTGVGDLYAAEGPNRSYTGFFGGTSSAAPLVASAVASIEGIAKQRGVTAPPAVVRSLLIATGAAQQDGSKPAHQEPIGPRPDLRSAVLGMSAPIVSSPAVIRAFVGDTIRFSVSAADLDGEPIGTLSAGPLPNGASFTPSPDQSHGEFVWNAGAGQVGSYIVGFTATNSAQASDTTFIAIESAQRGPLISSPGGEFGLEAVTMRVTMHAADPNGDPITSFDAMDLPAGAEFQVDATRTSGVLVWRPAYDQAGQYVIDFTARSTGQDGVELSGSGLLVITVMDNDRDPVVLAPNTVQGAEGDSLSFLVTVSDPDGDAIAALRAEGLPSGAMFETSPTNGSAEFRWAPGFDQAGYFFVNFFAENEGSGMAGTALIVSNVDRAPTVLAPEEVQGVEGQEVAFDVSVTEPDGDPIIDLRGEDLPTGSALSVNLAPPSARFVWTPQPGQAGRYAIRLVTVSSAGPGQVALSDTALVGVDVVAMALSARAFSNAVPLRLGSGASRYCIRIEPVDGGFNIADLDWSTLRLSRPAGSGIRALEYNSAPLDADNNGVLDQAVCFGKDDLRQLFADLPDGRQWVSVMVEGRLTTGVALSGGLDIDVIPQRDFRDAAITANPSIAPVLSFHTARTGRTRLTVYDVHGRLIGTPLDDPNLPSGFHDVPLRAGLPRQLPTGVKYYKLESPDGTTTGRFLILK